MDKSTSQINHNSSNPSEKEILNFIIDRFDAIKNSKKINDLIVFHTMNKYMLMAHNQEELKILGNIVANHDKVSLSKRLEAYERHLLQALKTQPTAKKHINTIMHIFGSFAKYFNQQETDLFFDLLSKLNDSKITIGEILSELEPIIYRFNSTYLASQTYFLLYADTKPGMLFGKEIGTS